MTNNKEARPRYAITPNFAYSDGDDAVYLASQYGLVLDDWQKEVLKCWLGRRADDKFSSLTCGISVPRQNGKNAIVEVRELYGICACGEAILHTAHELKTARAAFERLRLFFTNEKEYPELVDAVEKIFSGNGKEEIRLKNGGVVVFSARSSASNRGFTYDTIIYDEAQHLTDDQQQAISPANIAGRLSNPQEIYLGTPPIPSLPSERFRTIRDNALKGIDTECSWHEWSIEKFPDKTITPNELVDLARIVNPALGIRIEERVIKSKALTTALDGFAREHLGWWSEEFRSVAISERMWKDSFIQPEDVSKDGVVTFGVKFSIDGIHVAISACRRTQDGRCHVECIHSTTVADGLTWMIDFFCEPARKKKTAAIAIDGRNGTGVLCNALLQYYSKKAILIPSTRGVVDASVMFENGLRDQEITHTNDKDGSQDELDKSALTATKRRIGNEGGWGYGGENSAPLESCALAVWASRTTKRNPNRKAVVW